MISASEILNAKILIVDDQERGALVLRDLLTDAGYKDISHTTNPFEVCALHERRRFNLILLDLQMPGMNGFLVMKGLSEIESEGYLPVLAITAEPAYKLHALKAGAKDFISKPYDREEVLTRIHNMLEVRLLHEGMRNAATTMEILAMYDPLTGLANRRLLTGRISAAIANARRNRTTMAVVYLDLDGFKPINDTLGHGVGDTLLKKIAERLKAAVREEDTVARVGGDEFMIALWHVSSAADAGTVAAKLIRRLSQPYLIEGREVTVTASAGVGLYPLHGADADALMNSADTALYAAKRAGKNAFEIACDPPAPVQVRG